MLRLETKAQNEFSGLNNQTTIRHFKIRYNLLYLLMAKTYKVITVIDNLPFGYCHGDSSDDEQGMTLSILPFIMSLRRKVKLNQ